MIAMQGRRMDEGSIARAKARARRAWAAADDLVMAAAEIGTEDARGKVLAAYRVALRAVADVFDLSGDLTSGCRYRGLARLGTDDYVEFVIVVDLDLATWGFADGVEPLRGWAFHAE